MATEADFGIREGQTVAQETASTILSSVLIFMRKSGCCAECVAKIEAMRDTAGGLPS